MIKLFHRKDETVAETDLQVEALKGYMEKAREARNKKLNTINMVIRDILSDDSTNVAIDKINRVAKW